MISGYKTDDGVDITGVLAEADLLEEYGNVYYTYNGNVIVHCYADPLSIPQ